MNKVTIITGAGLRLLIDGARGVSTGTGRQVVISAVERDINIDLPPTAAVNVIYDEFDRTGPGTTTRDRRTA